jgi:uncharacterized protein involved in outer membrane biogenesis
VVAVKKVLIGLVGLIVALVAAVLIVPSVVDWNEYKKEITAQAKAFTGRELVIGGDIKIAVLPAPALRVSDVRLANLAGASSPTLVRLKSLEVRVAFGPLLTGRIEVETVKLVEPVIELEVLADGRKNWEFATKPGESATAKPAAPGAPGKAGTAMPAVRLDSFTIEGGTLVYRDAKSGTVERIEAINAKIAAGSLSGPFESAGSLRARGMPLRFDVTVGKIIEERTMPLTVSLGAGGAKAQLSGTVVNLTDVPRFRGKLKIEGASLAGVIQAVQADETLPGFLGQAFSAEGNVLASAEGGEVKDLEVVLGDSRATGAAAVKLAKGVNVQAQLAVNRVDLDKWLALPPVGAPSATGETKGKATTNVPAAKKPTPAPTKAAPTAWQIPNNVAGSFVLSVGAITYRGGVISQTRFKADMADGEITLSQFSTQLPGGSDLAVFGFINAVKGAPRFEGEAELSIADTRGVIKWLAVEPPPLPADRLRKLKLASKIVATPEQVQFGGLDAQFDGSRLTGGITVALRERPSFGADLVLDKINVDAYLPAQAPKKAGAGSSAPGTDKGKGAAPAPAAGPLDGLKVLSSFDANLKAQVKSLTYGGETMRDVVVDATLFNGALDIRRASVGQVAGVSLSVSGGLKGLSSAPEAKDLKLEARIPDLARLLAFAKIEAPRQAKGLGAIAATGRLDGNLLTPALDLVVKAAGAEVGVAGKATVLPVPGLSGTFKASAADLVKLLAALGVDYRPSGRIGAVSVASAIKAGPTAVELTGLKGSAGALTIQGSAQANFAGAKPKIVADLSASEIAVDPFLPAKKTASLAPTAPSRDGLLMPAAWPGAVTEVDPRHSFAQPAQARRAAPTAPPARRGQWPTDPLDLSALMTFDADVKLKATALAFDRYRLENADVAAQLANGVLKAERVTGVLFGGTLNGTAELDAGAMPKVNAVVTLKDADVAKAVQAFTGQAAASGRMSMDLTLATAGDTVAAMVSSLSGNGQVALNRLDVSGAGQGSALAGALGLVASLNQLGGALSGQPGRGAQADITGTFTIDKGVARSTDLKLVSGLGNGQAQGTVDLPRWGIDVTGQIQLAPSLLTQLVDKRAQAPQPVPFQVSGVLDAPNVKLDVSKLPAGLPIPGADRLLKKKGVGKVLEGILGAPGGQETTPSQPQAQPQQPQPQQQQQQQRRVRPEDLLKGLFR